MRAGDGTGKQTARPGLSDDRRNVMTDDRNRRDAQDRFSHASEKPYDVTHFAGKHGITMVQARNIIAEHGPAREDCDIAARRLY
jgi:hypothetical protein